MIISLKFNHFLKSVFRSFLLLIMLAFIFPFTVSAKNDGRKVYLFAYATNKNNGKNGLHFAWSSDKLNWHAVGPEYGFLKCDYGDWGSQKRMIAPFLFRDSNGLFHCLWSVNEKDEVFAYLCHSRSLQLAATKLYTSKEGRWFFRECVIC